MNQTAIHKLAASVFVASFFFPPFLAGPPGYSAPASCGYGFLFFEQTFRDFSQLQCRVDIPLLLVEWAFIAICLTVLHRGKIGSAISQFMENGKRDREAQILLSKQQADIQMESARVIADGLARHAEILQVQKTMF